MAVNERTGFLGGAPSESGPMDPAIGNRSTQIAAGVNLGNLGQSSPAGPAGEATAQQLVDDNTAEQLREIAATEGADISGASTKAEIADAILANRAK